MNTRRLRSRPGREHLRTWAKLHDPPAGSVDVSTLPASSTATQRDADGHEIPLSALAPDARWKKTHAEVPPVGSLDVAMLPPEVPTHHDVVGQDTLKSPTVAAVQALAPPVGSVEVRTSPALSPTTHSVTDGQAMLLQYQSEPGATLVVVHVPAPPVGSVDVSTLPALSAATHSVTDGQETSVR